MKLHIHKIISWTIYVLVMICVPSLSGQNHTIDSLRRVAKEGKEDTNKAKTLNLLSARFFSIGRYDTAMVCANNAAALSEKLDFKKGLSFAITNIGLIYDDQETTPRPLRKD